MAKSLTLEYLSNTINFQALRKGKKMSPNEVMPNNEDHVGKKDD